MSTSSGFVSPTPVRSAHSAAPPAASNRCSRFTPATPASTPLHHGPAIDTTPVMKKGRFNRPVSPQQQQRQSQRPSLPEDGTPIFAIFVRTQRTKLWYPLGAVQGDDRSKTLVNGLKGGFTKGMYENALDKGIAQTIFGRDRERFLNNAVRMYPQLKRYTKELEFGYRVAAVGLDEQPTKVISQEMAMSFFQWAKKKVDDTLNQDKN